MVQEQRKKFANEMEEGEFLKNPSVKERLGEILQNSDMMVSGRPSSPRQREMRDYEVEKELRRR